MQNKHAGSGGRSCPAFFDFFITVLVNNLDTLFKIDENFNVWTGRMREKRRLGFTEVLLHAHIAAYIASCA